LAAKTDLAFTPQGHFPYFENASEIEDLLFVIVFKGPAKDPNHDIGIVHSSKAVPPMCLLPYSEADVWCSPASPVG
jgi:oxalate decarboxylase